MIGREKRDGRKHRRSGRYEKRDGSISPTTIFVSCAKLNATGATLFATAGMVRPTLSNASKNI